MNKKTLILVVLVECILAIVLISIFGKAIESLYQKTLCTEIYFVDDNGNRIEEDALIVVDINDSNLDYQLKWVVVPDDASNKDVAFTASPSKYAVIDEYGKITFLQENVSITVVISTTDGSGKQATLRIYAE